MTGGKQDKSKQEESKMDAKQFNRLLAELKACEDARKWCKGKTLAEAWATCERADWMLWLLARHIGKPGWPSHQELVFAACDCAMTARKHTESKTRKSFDTTIKAARAWAKDPTEENRIAADAAAYAADAAPYAAAYAARKKMCAIIRKRVPTVGEDQ